MLNIYLPKPLLEYINNNKGNMSRALYIIKCIDYISRNNITINVEYNEGNKDDIQTKGTQLSRED